MNKQILPPGYHYGIHAGNSGLEHSWKELQENKKGRWEHGVGLYVTKDDITLSKYYKGNRTLYLVIWNGTHIDDSGKIHIDDMGEIFSLFPRTNRFFADVMRYMTQRKTREIPFYVIMNLAIANDMPSKNTKKLARILIENGADWAGDDKISCIWNTEKMRVIKVGKDFKYWDEEYILNYINSLSLEDF